MVSLYALTCRVVEMPPLLLLLMRHKKRTSFIRRRDQLGAYRTC